MKKSTLDPQFSAARMTEKDYRRLTANLNLVDTEESLKKEQDEEEKQDRAAS